MALEFFNIQSVNTYINELSSDGQLIHAVNCTGFPSGGISKRPGYGTIIGTVPGQVNSLFSFPYQNGNQINLYAASGSQLQFSNQGTGAWTQATPGTITNNAYLGYSVFNNILAIGDGYTNLWTSADGTTFTQPGSAPVAQNMAIFHNRLYTVDGTTQNVQYSVANDPTNWQNSGTSDSSSITTVSPGANNGLFVAGDRLIITKSRGNMFSWDDTTLTDLSTIYSASSPRSIAQMDDYWFYMNQFGIFGFDGATRTVLSNPIQRQFYNRSQTGIGTQAIGSAIGITHFWDYLLYVGTITDDFTGRTINNALIKYDYQKNQFMNWQFADVPTAMHSYEDINRVRQLVFGNSSGQIFQLNPALTSDNGKPISSEAVFLFTYAAQATAFSPTSASSQSGSSWEKKWNWLRLFFNPGDECNIQYAFSNTLQYQHLKWSEAINTRVINGDYWQVSDGVCELRFQNNPNCFPRSRFLFLRIYEDSDNARWSYYGCQVDAEPQIIK